MNREIITNTSHRMAAESFKVVITSYSIHYTKLYEKAGLNLGMNVIVFDINEGGWKLETELGVIMDGDKPEHIREAVPVIGKYCDIIGVRSFVV